MSLDAIGVRIGSDRSSLLHGYLEHYETLLGRKRGPLRILDLSLVDVTGARTFAEYIQEGCVVVNIHPDCPIHGAGLLDHPRLILERRNVRASSGLSELAELGPFNLILENGRHVVEDQLLAIECLFPALAPDGHLVIEAAFASAAEGAALTEAGVTSIIDPLRDVSLGLARGGRWCELLDCEPLRRELVGVTFAKHNIALRRCKERGLDAG